MKTQTSRTRNPRSTKLTEPPTPKQELTGKWLAQIQVPPHRQRHLPAPVLLVDQQQVQDGIGRAGRAPPVAVERLALLDEATALSRARVDLGHDLARHVLQALAKVAVDAPPGIRVGQAVLRASQEVPVLGRAMRPSNLMRLRRLVGRMQLDV